LHVKRSAGFWLLAALFAAFVLFLYGPMLAIFVPSCGRASAPSTSAARFGARSRSAPW
jgi:ABC-type spermidine/putrescine transport system permease subunit II